MPHLSPYGGQPGSIVEVLAVGLPLKEILGNVRLAAGQLAQAVADPQVLVSIPARRGVARLPKYLGDKRLVRKH